MLKEDLKEGIGSAWLEKATLRIKGPIIGLGKEIMRLLSAYNYCARPLNDNTRIRTFRVYITYKGIKKSET